jgi:hypothetical protein
MKMLTVYLEHALEFERLASSEQSEAFKAELLKQATAYRMLAEKRGEQYGVPKPSPSEALPHLYPGTGCFYSVAKSRYQAGFSTTISDSTACEVAVQTRARDR